MRSSSWGPGDPPLEDGCHRLCRLIDVLVSVGTNDTQTRNGCRNKEPNEGGESEGVLLLTCPSACVIHGALYITNMRCRVFCVQWPGRFFYGPPHRYCRLQLLTRTWGLVHFQRVATNEVENTAERNETGFNEHRAPTINERPGKEFISFSLSFCPPSPRTRK